MKKRGVLSAADHFDMLAEDPADPLFAERLLPDYTWPWRIPLDALRRLLEQESAAALRLALQSRLPTP